MKVTPTKQADAFEPIEFVIRLETKEELEDLLARTNVCSTTVNAPPQAFGWRANDDGCNELFFFLKDKWVSLCNK